MTTQLPTCPLCGRRANERFEELALLVLVRLDRNARAAGFDPLSDAILTAVIEGLGYFDFAGEPGDVDHYVGQRASVLQIVHGTDGDELPAWNSGEFDCRSEFDELNAMRERVAAAVVAA